MITADAVSGFFFSLESCLQFQNGFTSLFKVGHSWQENVNPWGKRALYWWSEVKYAVSPAESWLERKDNKGED